MSNLTLKMTFENDFAENGIEAFHIGGHTPGFTMYLFDDLLFICDYVFLRNGGMMFNTYGPIGETSAGGRKIRNILEGRTTSKVCGWNYVVEYAQWKEKFDDRPISIGH